MVAVTFRWDESKARINLAKHGVSFDEATTVFGDEFAIIIADPDHSSLDEDRFLLLGMSRSSRTLVVCHCFKDESNNAGDMSETKVEEKDINRKENRNNEGTIIRIISTRKAKAPERKNYEGKRNAR